MLEKMLYKIVNQMELYGIIDSKWKEHYIYALVIIVERLITVSSIIVISLVTNNFIPTIVFLGFFFLLRKRTGGFHAKKFWQCYMGTVITYILIVLLCPIFNNNKNIMYALVVFSIILIGIIGTINHPNMSMDSLELKESKKAARFLVVLEGFIVYVFRKLNLCEICIYYMSIAIVLCAALLCIAKILRQEV